MQGRYNSVSFLSERLGNLGGQVCDSSEGKALPTGVSLHFKQKVVLFFLS